ncbi:glutathione S-transferase [Sneathiella sp. P13V-1]|uniref:glutathione S-transferase n=1 Tax=Sneathiella sp. P13V-1 TaxID=2697366 RepID=UPI00187B3C46|nr:glutathione S-transferase [Sneathiella sp. P13V-1]MBE7635351.1 glutathione S-transferase [Sneathiella sp. P13V-1]
MSNFPVIYSFRRCPYAMRARMAVLSSKQKVELRDILLKDKPASMIDASPKATVPVLVLADGTVIDESLDVVHWALQKNDPSNWYPQDDQGRAAMEALIAENDGPFKSALDKYKYHVRFPEMEKEEYRKEGEKFLLKLDSMLKDQPYLFGQAPTYADICIFPFVRQFANSDLAWFESAPYPHLQKWLNHWVESDLFKTIMKKQPIWQKDAPPLFFTSLNGNG